MPLLPRRHPAEEELVALLDGELGLPERAAVERHLTGCMRCSRQRMRLDAALRALAAELATDVAAVAEPAPEWRLRPAVRVAGAGVLAGSVGALLVAGLVRRRQQRRAALRAAA